MTSSPKKSPFQYFFTEIILFLIFLTFFVFSFYFSGKPGIILKILSLAVLPFLYVVLTLHLTSFVYEFDDKELVIRKIFIKKVTVVCRVYLSEIEKIEQKNKNSEFNKTKLFRYTTNLFPKNPILIFTSEKYENSIVLIENDEVFQKALKGKCSLYKITENSREIK